MTYRESDKTDALDAQHPIPSGAIGCFRDRLKNAMGTRAARVFARDSGLSEGAIRSYLSGETYPTLDRLEQIAKAAGVSAMWLAFGEERQLHQVTEDDICVYVPLYDGQWIDGSWTKETQILTHLGFASDSLREQGLEASRLSAIRVDGDSMEGLLSDGDTVLFDHDRNTMEGDAVYVIRLDDHLLAKRLQRQIGGGVSVISTNPAYQTMTVEKDNLSDLEIVGRVVWVGGWI